MLNVSEARGDPQIAERWRYRLRTMKLAIAERQGIAQRVGRNKLRPWNILGTATRMKTIALIDTRPEIPGVSLRILVSTHPDNDGRFRRQRRFSKDRGLRPSHPDQNRHPCAYSCWLDGTCDHRTGKCACLVSRGDGRSRPQCVFVRSS